MGITKFVKTSIVFVSAVAGAINCAAGAAFAWQFAEDRMAVRASVEVARNQTEQLLFCSREHIDHGNPISK